MYKNRWSVWNLLSNLCFCLVTGCVSLPAIAGEINCNLTELTYHPVKFCALIFRVRLSLLSQEDKIKFEKHLKQLTTNKETTYYEDYAYLFAKYPKPELLFGQLQLIEFMNKYSQNNKIISFDNPDCCTLSEYINTATSYDIIISMLENQSSLNMKEKDILQISKKRTLCIRMILTTLRNNQKSEISTKEISTKCYH